MATHTRGPTRNTVAFMRSSTRKALALCLGMLLITTACASNAPETASDLTATAAANEHLTGEFASLDGQTIELDSLQGDDVVLWFWAPW